MSMLMRVLVAFLMLCLPSSAADCPAGKLAEEKEVTSLLQVKANVQQGVKRDLAKPINGETIKLGNSYQEAGPVASPAFKICGEDTDFIPINSDAGFMDQAAAEKFCKEAGDTIGKDLFRGVVQQEDAIGKTSRPAGCYYEDNAVFWNPLEPSQCEPVGGTSVCMKAKDIDVETCADVYPNSGYQTSDLTRVFWSKNSCMTVLYCLDHFFIPNDLGEGDVHAMGKMPASRYLHTNDVEGGETPAMGKMPDDGSKAEPTGSLNHKTCASKNNIQVKAEEAFKEDQEVNVYDRPGCTEWMSHFMLPFRKKLLDTYQIDLYADYGDKQLICENAVAKKYKWGTPLNVPSGLRQLEILKVGVKKATIFAFFDENQGDFCKAEKDASSSGHPVKLDYKDFLVFAEKFLRDNNKIGHTTPPDSITGDKMEAKFGRALADWFANAIGVGVQRS